MSESRQRQRQGLVLIDIVCTECLCRECLSKDDQLDDIALLILDLEDNNCTKAVARKLRSIMKLPRIEP